MAMRTGRHFLQIPGPTQVPDRVLRAIDAPVIDHRGPEFAAMTLDIFERLRWVFQTTADVVIYPASGTGAWEAALVNTLSPGEKILMFETGHFAMQWSRLAARLGLDVELVPGDWRHGVDPEQVHARLADDRRHTIKAVAVVHNETSTGVTSNVAAIRRAMDGCAHPALLMADTISSLAAADYRHDEWGVDVTVAGSQKGLMLPPGLSFNAVSAKARAAAESATLAKSYWGWEAMLAANAKGFFPYTPATNLLYGLREALCMLAEEGLPQVLARHARLAEAARVAVRAWDLDTVCLEPAGHSASLTAVLMPDGHDADQLRKVILERFNMSLGSGLGKLQGRVFRIGHLGDFNDLMLAGTLCGVEMGLAACAVPFAKGGVAAALDYLGDTSVAPSAPRPA